MPEENNIELRSEEVQDILTRMPHWMIRWGNMIILAIIFLVFLFAYFIKYPDIVTGTITITTQKPPEKVLAKSTGRIEHLLVQDRSMVEINTPLAVIENPANLADVYYLKNVLDTLDIDSKTIRYSLIRSKALKLGDIENAYAVFEKDFLAYQINQEYEPYNIDKASQTVEAKEQAERLKLLIEQKNIAITEITYKEKDLERHRVLLEKGVIAPKDFDDKNVEYLQLKKNINGLSSQISSIRSSLNSLGTERKTTKLSEVTDLLTLKRNLGLSLSQLKKAISDWEMQYVLKSSISGRVSYLKVWSEQQSINVGENVFVVVPTHSSDYIGKLKISAFNSGKIKTGQKVNVRLANYPEREFGIIKGKVKLISLVPDNENNLLIDVELTDGLKTSYNKKVAFQQEMSGTADVVTEDLRLIERILYQFRDLFRR